MKIIGIDFDNTIINYDNLFHSVSLGRGLVHSDVNKDKKTIRDAIRLLPDGEVKWQEVQAEVYGKEILSVEVDKEILRFIHRCTEKGISVFIVSHKTEFAAQGEPRINLRDSAMEWLNMNGFFEENMLRKESVYFEPTRQKKIARIIHLGCQYFIDDLVETFRDPSFPDDVIKILYDPHKIYEKKDFCIVHGWSDIRDFFL